MRSARQLDATRAHPIPLPFTPMRLFILVSALVVVSACGNDAQFSPEHAHDAARAAIEAGDATQATRIYQAAARTGDLHAMATLARAYQQGYYRRGTVLDGRPGATNLVTRQSDVQARRWMNRFTETVRRPSDDPTHRYLLALDLLRGQSHPESAWELGSTWQKEERATPAQRDSAIAILEDLLPSGEPGVAFALASTTDDRHRQLEIYWTAAAHGDVQSCFWAALRSTDQWSSAAGMAAYLDAREPCESMPGADRVDHANPLEALRAQVEIGNGEAVALMDSLVVLGAIPDA